MFVEYCSDGLGKVRNWLGLCRIGGFSKTSRVVKSGKIASLLTD